MSDQPTDRQALYDRIRGSSKDDVIFEEMVRLGFWPSSGGGPGDLATEMAERAELRRKLRTLKGEQTRLENEESILKELRKRRMREARERREETKRRRETERLERAAAWEQRKAHEIGYLGEGFSALLGRHDDGELAKLSSYGLDSLANAESLAVAMGISVGELRWLAFSRRVSETTHYQRFTIPKKTGGERHISAPMPRLKAAQHWVLANILNKIPLHDAAHGFRPGRSIVTNAEPHVGKVVVVNLDLKDFFPTVTFPRVLGQFRALGYSGSVATILALLCSEPDIDTVELDGKTWHVAVGERRLPQGAPTSPALTNIMCRRLDRKLMTLATNMGFTYTRYADDLTFSGSDGGSTTVGKLLRRVRYLVAYEGFIVHPDKTRVFRRSRRQEVTGLSVNDKLGVERKTLRRFKAVLFQIDKDGPEGKSWGESADVLSSCMGYANFVFMVDPAKGGPLREQVKALQKRYGWRPPAGWTARPAAPKPAPGVAEALALGTGVEPAAEANAEPGDANAEPGDAKSDKPWWKLW